MVKKPNDFTAAVEKNKKRANQVLPYTAGSRKPRSRPRSEEESLGIALATAEKVREAFRSGKLVRKSPKGFILK